MSIYHQVSGTSINVDTKLRFEAFEGENCYLTYLRSSETWGNCALVNITLPPTTNSIIELLATELNEADKFVDKNVEFYDHNISMSYVRIYKTSSLIPDFDPNMDNYFFINNVSILRTDIQLQYINEDWCVLKGLPTDYAEFINNKDSSKYYIVTKQLNNEYQQHPSAGSKMVKINNKNYLGSSILNEPVRLVLNSPVNQSHSQRYNTTKLFNLTKSVSVLGETVVSGLVNSSFIGNQIMSEDEFLRYVNINLGYLNYVNYETSFTDSIGYYFFLVNSAGVKISDTLYLQKNEADRSVFTYDGNGNKYLLFKSKQLNSTTPSTYLKVTYETSNLGLAIYHESLPFTNSSINSVNTISDANPPALDITRLYHNLDRSLFDIKGYVKIKKNYNENNGASDGVTSKIGYVKEMRSSIEKLKYKNDFGFTDMVSPKRFETIYITSSTTIQRTGNIRPKPNGSPYLPTDKRLYVWANNFIVGDNIKFKMRVNDIITVPSSGYLQITSINYDENYIGFDVSLGVAGIIPAENDLITVPQIITEDTNILSSVDYAVCDDITIATRYGMDSVMVDIQIPSSVVSADLYDGIYRQFAICYNPKFYNKVNDTMEVCTSLYYKNTNTTINLFNAESHSYDPGTVMYLSNKQPIYRKYMTTRESFKLII